MKIWTFGSSAKGVQLDFIFVSKRDGNGTLFLVSSFEPVSPDIFYLAPMKSFEHFWAPKISCGSFCTEKNLAWLAIDSPFESQWILVNLLIPVNRIEPKWAQAIFSKPLNLMGLIFTLKNWFSVSSFQSQWTLVSPFELLEPFDPITF